MKVRGKIISSLVLMIVAVSGILIVSIMLTSKEIKQKDNDLRAELIDDVEEKTRQEILDLAKNISNYALALEGEIDRNMLNAAYVLYEADRLSGGRLTLQDLERLKRQTGMSDLYLGDMNGIFTVSTEPGAAGISLFDIWDGYRMLVTGESDYLPSDLKIKVETGEIFKFTAISRADNRGILESALDAGSIENHLQSFIETNRGIRSINLFDFTLLTLTENRLQDTPPVYKKGEFVPAGNTEVADLFAAASNISLALDRQNAQIYYPVIDNGSVRYVLFMDIDTSGYFVQEALIESAIVKLEYEIRILNIISLTVIFAVVLFFTFIISLIVTRILKPLGFLENMLDYFSKGNLTLKVPDEFLNRKDEMGTISLSCKNSVENLKKLIISIKNQSVMLSDTGNDLASNMTETAAAINEITANIQSIKSRVLNQSAGVTETHATMEQVMGNINKLDGLVEKQSANVSGVSSAIEEMAGNINSVTGTLANNAANVHTLRETSEVGRTGLQEVATDIQEISRESEGLMEINSVMQNIASQTNLLSMNAAIEAAHAGEAGKGFAVVADEIRKLAESSSEQSKTIVSVLKKIKGSIDKITQSTANVLNKFEAIDESVKTVSAQEENIQAAMEKQGAGSRQIVAGVTEVNEITRQVKSGSQEMLDGSKEVIAESNNLEHVTQEITQGMNEMANGAEQVNTAVNHVNDLTMKNRSGIETLIREVSRFKVDE